MSLLRINQVPHGFEAFKDWPVTAFPIHERFESMGTPPPSFGCDCATLVLDDETVWLYG